MHVFFEACMHHEHRLDLDEVETQPMEPVVREIPLAAAAAAVSYMHDHASMSKLIIYRL